MAPKKDFTQVANGIFEQATGVAAAPAESAKQIAGRKGGLKGGAVRMGSLTAEQKRELSMSGVSNRLSNKRRP